MQLWPKARRCGVAALSLSFISATVVAQATFTGLGDLPGGVSESRAFGVNADGSVVVGLSRSSTGIEAFRWTSVSGIDGLGDLAGGAAFSRASGVDGSGDVVVGWSEGANGLEAFRWTSDAGMQGLGDLAGGAFESVAQDINVDGDVIVGWSRSSQGREAFRWTSAGGLEGLGALPSGGFYSAAFGVSADGQRVVGQSQSQPGPAFEAFRGTTFGGLEGLGDFDGGDFESLAFDTNADGSVVVGYGESDQGFVAFRWTAEDGLVSLGDLPGGDFESTAKGVNADGSVIVGHGEAPEGRRAIIWTETLGFRDLANVLSNEFALNLDGWTLTEATAISANGLAIVGYGLNPEGDTEAWIATIPPLLPEPAEFATGNFTALGTTFGPGGSILDQSSGNFSGAESMSDGGSTGSGPVGAFASVSFFVDRQEGGVLEITASGDGSVSNGCNQPGFRANVSILTNQAIAMTLNGSYDVETQGQRGGLVFNGPTFDQIAPGTYTFGFDFDTSQNDFEWTLRLTPTIGAGARVAPSPAAEAWASRSSVPEVPDTVVLSDGRLTLRAAAEGSSGIPDSGSSFVSTLLTSTMLSVDARAGEVDVDADGMVDADRNRGSGEYRLRLGLGSQFDQVCGNDFTYAGASLSTENDPFTLELDRPHEVTLPFISSDISVTIDGNGEFHNSGTTTLPAGTYSLAISLEIVHDTESVNVGSRDLDIELLLRPTEGPDLAPYLDQNEDGTLDFLDVIAYLRLFDARDDRAELTGFTRSLNDADVRFFLDALEAAIGDGLRLAADPDARAAPRAQADAGPASD
ncbi:MAG: hypothetical protein AAGK04_07895 [Planctomycetota bacterium]